MVEAFVQPQRLVGGFGACVEGPAPATPHKRSAVPCRIKRGSRIDTDESLAMRMAREFGPRAEGKAAVKHQRIAEEFGNNFGIPREVAEVDPPDAPSGQHPAHRPGQAAEQGIDFARDSSGPLRTRPRRSVCRVIVQSAATRPPMLWPNKNRGLSG